MAVLDHPVHPKTVGSDRYDACQAKVRKPNYWAPQRRYFPDGSFEITSVRVPDPSSKTCRYDMSLTDSKCEGCPQRGFGESYNKMVRELGA
jgi:hypothetical protein